MLRTGLTCGWSALLLSGLIGVLDPAQAAAGAAAAKASEPVAVIVHQEVAVDDLNLADLQQIFLGKRRAWVGDRTITLLMPPRDSPERKVLLNQIYGQRSESQYQHYWINKLLGDGTQITPKTTGSPEMTASLVREIPGAIALIRASRVPRGVKVLRIDGRLPDEAGYTLTTRN
jgi:ABC-type phosphate transport system substrate-binding protein